MLGPTVEFLTSPQDKEAPFWVISGTIPPGVFVLPHSHADPEVCHAAILLQEFLATAELLPAVSESRVGNAASTAGSSTRNTAPPSWLL